ncbi:unnamed protein product [Scytosiphon promiscuus]
MLRFAGAPEDPLLRAEVSKKEDRQHASKDEAAANEPTEAPVEADASEHDEEVPASEQAAAPMEDAESVEKALTKQRLVRSVLCTRVAIPADESVSNRVLRAVLRGDTEEVVDAVKRKRLKGVAIALTADGRKRTALHMAAGTGNVRMVRALMQWRRELNRSLQDDLDSLDDRREIFVHKALSAFPTGKMNDHDIDRFEAWLSEERRRLVRVTELRCEECWRRSVTARDDKGMTPLHWAATAGKSDGTLIQTLLTTGRAGLSARDASSGPDRAVFSALRADLRRLSGGPRSPTHGAPAKRKAADNDTITLLTPSVFPIDGEFHRRTGKIRRPRIRRETCVAQAKGQEEGVRDACEDGASKTGLEMRQGPDGMTATAGKVKWFCGALAKTAERLSGRRRGGAEAFLLSVFEDFDSRSGHGTLSMQQFREVLHDVHVRVSEETLLEVGRYFQAPTLRCRRSRHEADRHKPGNGNNRSTRDADDAYMAPLEMSYVPLMDIAFGRTEVRETSARRHREGKSATCESLDDGKEEESSDVKRSVDIAFESPFARCEGETHDYDFDNGDGDNGDDDRCYVNVSRIRAARVTVIEIEDALGRSPLFLAAAADAVPAVKTLLRHGAESSLAVKGTNLTPHSVAQSLLTKRILAAEAGQSLRKAISERTNGHYLCGRKDEVRRMETWVSTLAEGELASAGARETRVDQKTSLHLAAAAGLPEAVKDLLRRGVGDAGDGGRYGKDGNGAAGVAYAPSKWDTSWKPSDQRDRDASLSRAHHAHDHEDSPQGVSRVIALATDANGWSALHACCAEASPQHLSCAVALLGSQRDPNAQTNTGKTPLHVAASSAGWGDHRGGGDIIPLLVGHGGDLEAQDHDGLRPIHFAAKTGCHVALLALLTAGADPWSKTPRGWNALHYAVVGRHVHATRLLAYWDSDTGIFGQQKNCNGARAADLSRTSEIKSATSTIWQSAALGEAERVSRSCQESSRSSKDTTGKPWRCPGVNSKTPGLGFTPLHACMAGLAAATVGEDVSRPCTPPRSLKLADGGAPKRSMYARLALGRRRRYGDGASVTRKRNVPATPSDERDYIGVCRALLAAGADVHSLDTRCRTPLALAAAAGSSVAVEMLLRAGADPRSCDADGNSPLHFAFAYANAAVAALLGEEGADQDVCNRGGKTAQDVGGLRAGLAPDERVSVEDSN